MRFIDLKTTVYTIFYTIFKENSIKQQKTNYLQLLEEGRMKKVVEKPKENQGTICMKV